MLEADSKTQACKLKESPARSNHLRCSSKTKTPHRSGKSNPFGGRRMIFTSYTSPSTRQQSRIYRNGESFYNNPEDLSGNTYKPNLVSRESGLLSRQTGTRTSSKTEIVISYDDIEEGKDKDEETNPTEDRRKALDRREESQAGHRSAKLRNRPTSMMDVKDKAHQDTKTNFSNAQKIDRGADEVNLNFMERLLKPRESFPKPDKYTIVFTEDCHQDMVPNTPSIVHEEDSHQNQQTQSGQSSKSHDNKPNRRKFVIRREKHDADNGRDEDATYTIHVCCQLLGESSHQLTPDTQTRKKETRGEIFRRNASLRHYKQMHFTQTTPCDGENKVSAGEFEREEPMSGKCRIKKLSSLSPPRQNRGDVGSNRRRATSQHAGETREKKRSRSKPIRLIDHLERRERAMTARSEQSGDCSVSLCGDTKPNEETDRHMPTTEFKTDKDVHYCWNLGGDIFACDYQSAGGKNSNPNLSPKTQRKMRILKVNKTKDKRSSMTKAGEEDITIDVNEKVKGELSRESVELQQRYGNVKETPCKPRAVLMKDAACQVSPPVATCCLCHCHTTQSMPRGKVTTKRQVYHSIRNYYPSRKTVKVRGRSRQENSRTESVRKSGEEGSDVDEIGKVEMEEVKNVEKDSRDDENEHQKNKRGHLSKATLVLDKINSTQKFKRNIHNRIEGPLFETLSESHENKGPNVCTEESDEDLRAMLTASDSSTSAHSGCKNNSATKRADGKSRTASNSFREIVEQAKRRSSINVRPLDKNSSFQRHRDTPVCGRTGQTEEAGHYFIGDYLLSLWKKQVLCDVRVNVNNTHFLAHKLVLAAFSDIFTPTTPYPEPTLQFCVPNAKPESVYRVFKYIYTACMDVRDDQLEETLHVGIFLGINEIRDVILEILSKPTLDNLELYIDIQNRCGIPASVMDYPHLYQCYLIHMIYMEKFLELKPDELEAILRDPNVLVETELDTLHALAIWAQYNPLERVSEVPRLLDFIIFEVISPENIAKIVQLYDPIFSEMASRNKISEVFRFHALQLCHQVCKNQPSFVPGVPGISQDPMLDRVSYIPSQYSLSKHQQRPICASPSARKSQVCPPRRSGVNSVRPSITRKSNKSTQFLLDQIKKSFSSQLDQEPCTSYTSLVRPPNNSKRESALPNENGNATTSSAEKKVRRKPKIADRSNNSYLRRERSPIEMNAGLLQEEEDLYKNSGVNGVHNSLLDTSSNMEKTEEVITPIFQAVSHKSNRRLRRQDLWTKASHRLGRGEDLRHGVETRNSPFVIERTACEKHGDLHLHLSELQLYDCDGKSYWGKETGDRERGEGEGLVPKGRNCQEESKIVGNKTPVTSPRLPRSSSICKTASSLCYPSNYQLNTAGPYESSTRRSSQARCKVSQVPDCHKQYDFNDDNKNSNASSLFELV